MYTNISDIRFEDGNFHRNIDTIFRATFTMKYEEKNNCNIGACLLQYVSKRPTDE